MSGVVISALMLRIINGPLDIKIKKIKLNTWYKIRYSLRSTLFVLFEKSNILREHHLLFCLPYKNV